MTNLPEDMKVHDSDPPTQTFWTGLVHGTVRVHDTVIVRERDGCADERGAMAFAQDRLLGAARERNPGLDCEAGDDFRAEPD